MKTKSRHLFRGAVLIALLAVAFLGSSTAAFAQESATSPGPKGSWLYTVTIPDFGSFQGVETYSGGGGYSEADQLSFNPASVASAGHGAWHLNGNTVLSGPFTITATQILVEAPAQ